MRSMRVILLAVIQTLDLQRSFLFQGLCNKNIANYKNRKVCPGLVGTGLFHLLENNAFDLSLRYTFTVLKAKLKYDKVYNADCYGIVEVLFGVKF